MLGSKIKWRKRRKCSEDRDWGRKKKCSEDGGEENILIEEIGGEENILIGLRK